MNSEHELQRLLEDEQPAISVASITSYEDQATGAPVENASPLGYHFDSITVVLLNISTMIGTGVFSTPGSILYSVGSVGLSLIYWVIGYSWAGASLAVYLEYASYFPLRSGADVVYLEKHTAKAYPKPRFLLPTVFAVQSVLLSFSSGNAIVVAQYLLVAGGAETSTWNVRGLAIGIMTAIVLICIGNTRWSLRLSNTLGAVKVITLVFIAMTGLVVLGGHTRVEDPHANFRNLFVGTTSNGNGLATALAKVNFAYTGFENAFNVLHEVRDPVRTMKRYAPLSLTVVFVLYFFANIAYFAAIPKEEIRTSKELTASLFFIEVFGGSKSVKALNALVAISGIGNLLGGVIGASRIIRECGRQGVLPYPRIWASTKPFNTPLGPYLLQWFLTVMVILGPPAGDAFNFIVDLNSYPASVFRFLLTVGLFFVRRRRAKVGAPKPDFRAWNIVLIFAIFLNIYLLVLPWVPPEGGIYEGDVSFFYATYCLAGIGILVISGLGYLLYIHILPALGGYAIRQLVQRLDDGAITNKLVRVPNAELAKWDSIYDEHGEVILRRNEVPDPNHA